MENNLSQQLKNYRANHHLTQKELAALLHVSDKTISKWERQAGLPDIATLKQISNLLNISLDELLDPEAPPTYFEFCSSFMIGLLPLIHIVIPNFNWFYRQNFTKKELFHQLRELPKATGIFSLALFSRGIVSFGIVSQGIFSLGVFSFGLVSIGAISTGLLAFGNFTAGLAGFGNFSIGILSMGNFGLGLLALGNFAAGYLAIANRPLASLSQSMPNHFQTNDVIRALENLKEQGGSIFLINPLLTVLQSPALLSGGIILLVTIVLLAVSFLLYGLIQMKKDFFPNRRPQKLV
ncbi:helix-turn-helix transcriptional regulator [Enterococcus sp. AZ103]|uniref:helix-turn-helix transcriptional regulator n=1 Tax=Enterococcus sp. AZ103 TaxID=2774628 RepID=UPI003F24987B